MRNTAQNLSKSGMDYNDLNILEFYNNDQQQFLHEVFIIPSLKDFNMSCRYQFLKVNEYLTTEVNDSSKIVISEKGKAFLKTVYQEPVEITQVMVENEEHDKKFEEWWKIYPTTPSWKTDDKGTSFLGSRNLKNLRKADAKKRYLALLNQGLKHEDLLGSLRFEISIKKLDSIKKKQNQMEYFKGMESYFNQERYLHFIDMYKDEEKHIKNINSQRKNVTDI